MEDARRRARRAVPRPVFDYIDGGADDEVTMGENVRAFRQITFRPRMAVGPVDPDTATTLLGTPLSLPVVLGPAGLVRVMHPDGAAGVARAAADAGTISVLSTVAGTSLEDVAATATGPMWFQLYAPGGPSQSDELIDRARAARYTGIVVTVDTAALGNRERDVRHGVVPPLRLTPTGALRLGTKFAARPRWLLGMARAEAGARRRGASAPTTAGPTATGVVMAASPFSWGDVAAIRRRWPGTLVVKGVLGAGDARLAVEAGADAVVVSNHGGRQLDGAPATLRVLPSVVDAVAGRAAVLLDGGVRRGSDVVKALAVGADAVMIGRAYLYGLAACGRPGVQRVVEILRAEMVRTLALMGCPSVGALDRSWVDLPAGWETAAGGPPPRRDAAAGASAPEPRD